MGCELASAVYKATLVLSNHTNEDDGRMLQSKNLPTCKFDQSVYSGNAALPHLACSHLMSPHSIAIVTYPFWSEIKS
jgi:hypothetical protein